MSISNNYVPVKQLGNGVTTQFSGNWKVLNASYIRVYLESVATGIQTLQTLGANFTLVFNDAGFTVTMNVAPTSANYVVIGRAVDLTQTDPYRTSKGFQGKTIEDSFDKLTAIEQDQNDQIGRSLKFKLGSSVSLFTIDDPINGRSLKWDTVNNRITNSTNDIDTVAAQVAADALVAANAATAAGNAQTAAQAAQAAAEAAAAAGNFRIASGVGGTVNAATITVPNYTAYTFGSCFVYTPTGTNTAAIPTANINGLGARNIVKSFAGALVPASIADIRATVPVMLVYTASNNLMIVGARTYSQGTDIASAATVNADTATGDYVNITGTTNITAVTLQQGAQITMKFAGILTLTNGASLILPSGANITTAAGDIAIFRGEAGGVVRCIDYERADGTSVNAVPITPWVAYTPTFVGLGTLSAVEVFSRRVGDTLQIKGRWTAGTPTAVEARMNLGFNGTDGNVTASSSRISSAVEMAGTMIRNQNDNGYTVLCERSVGYVTFGWYGTPAGGISKMLGNNIATSGARFDFFAQIPIQGW